MKHALPRLIETAEAARDQASAALAQVRQAVAQAATTLQRLQDFRAECLSRSAAGTLGATDGAGLQGYQRFVGRLDEAIALQQQEVRRREARVQEQQLRLQECQRKLMAFQALQRREADAANARAQRREQREADEFAARAFGRSLGGSTP